MACGGDGTVRAVAETLAGTATRRSASFRSAPATCSPRTSSIPVGLDAVPDRAVGFGRRRSTSASVNDEKFTVMAGVGFDAVMIRDAERGGQAPIRQPGVRVVRGSAPAGADRSEPPSRSTARTVWSGRTAMVLVGNCGAVTGGLEVFPDATPDDGVLDVAVLTAQRARDWLRVMWRLVRRKPQLPTLVRAISRDLDRSPTRSADGVRARRRGPTADRPARTSRSPPAPSR